MTLCRGEKDGIRKGMGVISKQGVVGIVKAVSRNYATVQLILNGQSSVSVKIKSKNYHGNLIWDSEDIQKMTLIDVPKHATIEKGDSLVTSGYSISYPPEIYVGIIEDFMIEGGGNNYNIDVKLDYDLARLEYVYVVNFIDADEKATLLNNQDE